MSDTSEYGAERVEQILEEHYGDRVYTVEDGVVWVSGMNINCRGVAESMAQELVSHNIPTGLVRDDDAARFGGVEFNFSYSNSMDAEQEVEV